MPICGICIEDWRVQQEKVATVLLKLCAAATIGITLLCAFMLSGEDRLGWCIGTLLVGFLAFILALSAKHFPRDLTEEAVAQKLILQLRREQEPDVTAGTRALNLAQRLHRRLQRHGSKPGFPSPVLVESLLAELHGRAKLPEVGCFALSIGLLIAGPLLPREAWIGLAVFAVFFAAIGAFFRGYRGRLAKAMSDIAALRAHAEAQTDPGQTDVRPARRI
jgi:hypothetical protein